MLATVPPLPPSCNSWIVEDIATGKAVVEIWCHELIQKVNGNLYRVHTALAWLQSLNENPPASVSDTL